MSLRPQILVNDFPGSSLLRKRIFLILSTSDPPTDETSRVLSADPGFQFPRGISAAYQVFIFIFNYGFSPATRFSFFTRRN